MSCWVASFSDVFSVAYQILMTGFGYSASDAIKTASVLVDADLKNIPSHGVSRLPMYKEHMEQGYIKTKSTPMIVKETPISIVVDGQHGPGCMISEFCIEKMQKKLVDSGVVFCSVFNSNHFGIAGYWSEALAGTDNIGIAMTNTHRACVPTFGREKVLGTNPLAVAFPLGKGNMFSLDMATSVVSFNKLEVCRDRHFPIPENWIANEEGRSTTDLNSFFRHFARACGGLYPLGGPNMMYGGHKGFGLNLLVELLCSSLSQGVPSFCTFDEGTSGISHFFAVINIEAFGPASAIIDHANNVLSQIKSTDKMETMDRIYIPGEKEFESRERGMKEGIQLDSSTKDMLLKFCADYDIEKPSFKERK